MYSLYLHSVGTLSIPWVEIIKPLHKGAICWILFWWIYYCQSSKSTTGKMHLCPLTWRIRNGDATGYQVFLKPGILAASLQKFDYEGPPRLRRPPRSKGQNLASTLWKRNHFFEKKHSLLNKHILKKNTHFGIETNY